MKYTKQKEDMERECGCDAEKDIPHRVKDHFPSDEVKIMCADEPDWKEKAKDIFLLCTACIPIPCEVCEKRINFIESLLQEREYKVRQEIKDNIIKKYGKESLDGIIDLLNNK